MSSLRLKNRPVAVATTAALMLMLPAGEPTAVGQSSRSMPSYAVAHPHWGTHRFSPRWNPCQTAITYRVNTDLAASTASARRAALRDVRTAVALTSAATGIRFRYLGSTSAVPTGGRWNTSMGDAEVVIAWVDPSRRPSTLLGRTSSGYVDASGGFYYHYWWSGAPVTTRAVIDRGYVVLNAAARGRYRAGFGPGVTRGELLLHELGHVMGLEHVSDPAQLMFPELLARRRAAFGPGDLEGLRQLGHGGGCISVPNAAPDRS